MAQLVEVVGMTALLSLIPRWVYAALIAMLAATSCKFKLDKDGLTLEVEKHKVAAAQLEASQQAALAQATAKARDTEQALVAKVETIQEESNAQITALARQRDDLRQRLRAAATAAVTARSLSGPASVAAIAATAAGSDRAELSGPAGYDLVSEAHRADTIRLQLATCERQYEAARDALK
ncbi:hypothetical protein [Simplicispira piscis]